MTAATLASLFSGARQDAYGTGEGRVIRAPLSLAHFEAHTKGGGPGLGLFPLRDDGTVEFAAVDLDLPDLDGIKMIQSCLPAPSWIEKSRSGNYHLWVFFDGPCPAWVARGLMREACRVSGYPRAEVFPKQDRLRPNAPLGNYINIPWHGDERPVFGDFTALGVGVVTPQDVLAAPRAQVEVWTRRVEWLGITEPGTEKVSGDGSTTILHPCAAKIIRERETNPVRDGHRNVVFFNLAKQLNAWSAINDDEAWHYLTLVNDASEPPLPETTLRNIFNNVRRGGFRSTGCDDPVFAPYADAECPVLRKAGLRV